MIGLRAALIALLVIAGGPLLAAEVSTPYRGLTLLGNLELADGKSAKDGIALIVHGTLAHDRMETIASLQANLKERHLSSLAITLSLGEDRRTGFFDCARLHNHRPYDSLDEIAVWIAWLKSQGAAAVTLIGHSQGGNQAAVYAVERRDPDVSSLILLAPGTFDFDKTAQAYQARYGTPLRPLLDKAEALVRAGRGAAPLERVGFLNCTTATATADSFVAWYAPEPRRDTPSILPRVAVRTLVIVAGADEVVPDLAAEAKALPRAGGPGPAAPGQGEITVRTVEGSDHFFRDLYNEDAADLIAAWLKG
ncbi:MAG: alpha/beta hydrolase [Alphaproteobacteria bacterium]|nr:alpha/beta hydrolase [Alphaproteobacteria bacterium]